MTAQSSPPTHAEVAYGPHEKNTYDFWKADADLSPVFMFIHGGGWTAGDKQNFDEELQRHCLEAGISFASVNYRFSTTAPLPAPVEDAARAIQHIRASAEKYGVIPERLATYGGSAGACTSFILALGPDFAAPDSADPVQRQSSRPSCAGGKDGQTAIDPVLLRDWLGDDILLHRMPNLAVGEATAEGMLENYDKHADTFKRFSAYHLLNPETAVPIFLEYSPRKGRAISLPAESGGVAIHHAEMGVRLKAKMDALGLECHLNMLSETENRLSLRFEFFKSRLLN